MTLQDFIFDLPLYTKVKVSDNHILDELCSDVHIDGYNPNKGVYSTFCLKYSVRNENLFGNHVVELVFTCQRYGDSIYVLIHFDLDEGYIEKVGQYPSVADIHIGQVKKYKKVLGDSYIHDFTRAIGLAANGIGTGSFVYLRRVFEHLVSEIGDVVIKKGEVTREQFESSKMENKIKLLSSYLPEVVTENKALYGVLSAGIHTLSEDDCLKYFSVVRDVIELILDEQEYARHKEEKRKNARNKLSSIAGEIKGVR